VVTAFEYASPAFGQSIYSERNLKKEEMGKQFNKKRKRTK
jgi:hypothetical protein